MLIGDWMLYCMQPCEFPRVKAIKFNEEPNNVDKITDTRYSLGCSTEIKTASAELFTTQRNHGQSANEAD
jgi:hypothetical protein